MKNTFGWLLKAVGGRVVDGRVVGGKGVRIVIWLRPLWKGAEFGARLRALGQKGVGVEIRLRVLGRKGVGIRLSVSGKGVRIGS